jgi:hypothetical protein
MEDAVRRGAAVNTPLVREWRWAILGGGLGLCLVGLAFLHGIVGPGRKNWDALWPAHLRAVNQALGKGDVNVAMQAWYDAYGAALGSGRWEAMVEVGDLSLRIGEVSGARNGFKPNARRAYRVALIRAVQQESPDGVLRTGEAFAALGDREVAEQCMHITERLAAQKNDPQSRNRVRAFAERLGTPLLTQEKPGGDLP